MDRLASIINERRNKMTVITIEDTYQELLLGKRMRFPQYTWELVKFFLPPNGTRKEWIITRKAMFK